MPKSFSVLRTSLLCGLVVSLASLASAGDWPSWRGPARNGISAETSWNSRWSASGPRKLWETNIGLSYSAVTVKGGRLYTIGSKNGQDIVYCFNADNGQPIWRRSYAHPRREFAADPNPDAAGSTPVVDGTMVYVLSREGMAVTLSAQTGQILWSRDLRREQNAALPSWGFTASAMIEGNTAFYNVGTAGIALDKTTGKVLWKSGDGTAGYATPVLFRLNGQKAVAIFTARGLVAVNPPTGRALWSHPWKTDYDVNAADPQFAGNLVFISSGYNRGGAVLNISGTRPAVVWENRNMRNHFNSSVILDGFLYGNDQNTLKCLDLKTGAMRWQNRGMGNGGLIAANGTLIAITERGELFTVAATPGKYTELSRARVIGGTCWIHPVLANGRIYCRSNEGNLVCVDVKGK